VYSGLWGHSGHTLLCAWLRKHRSSQQQPKTDDAYPPPCVTPSHPYLLSTPATPARLCFAEDTTTVILLINSLAFIEPLLADRPRRWPLPPPAAPTTSHHHQPPHPRSMASDHPGQNPPPPAVTYNRYSRQPPTRNRCRLPAYSPEPPRQQPRPGAPPLPHPPLLAGTRRRRLRLTAKHRHRQPDPPETACLRRGAPNPTARGGC